MYFPVFPDGGGPCFPSERPAASGGGGQRSLSDSERDGRGLHHADSPSLHRQGTARLGPDLRHYAALF